MPYAHLLLKSRRFCFQYFWKFCRQMNFAVVFRVNDCKYQNILLTTILANYSRCFLEGPINVQNP